MTEQNFEGVQTALDFVKDDQRLEFISMLQTDTIWDASHKKYQVEEKVLNTYPANSTSALVTRSNDSTIVKRSPFSTAGMNGAILLGFSTKAINAAKREIMLTSLLVSGMVSIIGIIIGLWLSKTISKPVLLLRNAAIKVGEGDFSQQVVPASSDEIADLGRAFNCMVDDLARSTRKLSEANLSLETANTALNTTLIELKTTQRQLVQSEKMASLGELTAGIAHEIQNPLNFVNNFSEISIELLEELETEMAGGNTAEVASLAVDIRQNLGKIAQHGKRADGIVKSMLQHSRQSAGQKGRVDINALVDEYLRLSYHGMRARDKSFNAMFETAFDSNIDKINMVGQDIGRMLLNFFNNAFYAVNKKKQLVKVPYEPKVTVSTQREGNSVLIHIRDNGTGIPQPVLDKIYQPFFTTKPTGEGTGLGLSLSYDIIKSHGGEIKVETKEGEFTEFRIWFSLQ
jgi:two-component system, NtrC family, sensor kinase